MGGGGGGWEAEGNHLDSSSSVVPSAYIDDVYCTLIEQSNNVCYSSIEQSVPVQQN